jgi:hypothetical protein
MSEFDVRPRVEREAAHDAAAHAPSPVASEAPRVGPSEEAGGNSILSSFAKPLDDEMGPGEAIDFTAERFSNVSAAMDSKRFRNWSGARGTTALGGTLGGMLGLVGSGFGIHDGVEDMSEGKTARGAAEVGRAGPQ